jgi:hypothetical protein
MSDQKTTVISVRLTPAVHAALSARAVADRQPLTRMAALLIEDGLGRKLVASVVPLATTRPAQVEPNFRPVKKSDRKGER